MTTSRGCTPHEASTAKRLAGQLGKKWGFTGAFSSREYRPDFDSRFARAEQRAAQHFAWEYRRCGKPSCHCARSPRPPHGPYKYGKRREGRTVRSIYMGK